MQSTNRQVHATVQDEGDDNRHGSPAFQRRHIAAATRFKPGEVSCFLLADSNTCLHPDLHREVRVVSNDPGYCETGEESSILIGLIPMDDGATRGTTSHAELMIQSATSQALPVVLVTEDVSVVRRTSLAPNIVDVVSNDPHGAQRVRELQSQVGANIHQEIWLVGEHDAYTASLLNGLGYQVHCVEKLHEVDCADECSNLRSKAVTVILNSCGPRSYSDFDKFPPRLEQALSGNECFSLFVKLDAQSAELKSLWRQRGVATSDTRYVSESDLVLQVQAALRQQHLLAMLQHDSCRDPRSGICNNNFLEESGRRLHATAQRGDSPFSVVVLQTRMIESLARTAESEIIEVLHECLSRELRESDVIAQRFPGELVCLVTSTGPYALPHLVERLHESVMQDVQQRFGVECSVSIGATAERGIGFDSMMHRATMAALQCQLPDSGLVVIL